MFVQLLNSSVIECNHSIARLFSPLFKRLNNTNNQMAFGNMVIWILDQDSNGPTIHDHSHDFIPFKFQTKKHSGIQLKPDGGNWLRSSSLRIKIFLVIYNGHLQFRVFSLNRTLRSCPDKFWDCSDNGPKPLPEINLKPNFQLVF